jgi:hypothetical protein
MHIKSRKSFLKSVHLESPSCAYFYIIWSENTTTMKYSPLSDINQGMLNEFFKKACKDYAYLVNRNYPERGTLKLVGDRYRLTRDQRTVLYRGITSVEKSELRKVKLVNDIQCKTLAIDGYNVLFSLLNYRLGRFTFISTDGVLRDAGSLHGKLKDEELFMDCITTLAKHLSAMYPSQVEVFLDSPVSHSERHAQVITDTFQQYNLAASCRVIRSADYGLKHLPFEVLATSDSVIIENTEARVVDLPRIILEKQYQAELVNIIDLLSFPVPE